MIKLEKIKPKVKVYVNKSKGMVIWNYLNKAGIEYLDVDDFEKFWNKFDELIDMLVDMSNNSIVLEYA